MNRFANVCWSCSYYQGNWFFHRTIFFVVIVDWSLFSFFQNQKESVFLGFSRWILHSSVLLCFKEIKRHFSFVHSIIKIQMHQYASKRRYAIAHWSWAVNTELLSGHRESQAQSFPLYTWTQITAPNLWLCLKGFRLSLLWLILITLISNFCFYVSKKIALLLLMSLCVHVHTRVSYLHKNMHAHLCSWKWTSSYYSTCVEVRGHPGMSVLTFHLGIFLKNSFSTAQTRIACLWSSRKLCFSSKGIQIVLYIQFLPCFWEFNLKSSHSHNMCFCPPSPITRLPPNSLVSKTLEWSKRTDVVKVVPLFWE